MSKRSNRAALRGIDSARAEAEQQARLRGLVIQRARERAEIAMAVVAEMKSVDSLIEEIGSDDEADVTARADAYTDAVKDAVNAKVTYIQVLQALLTDSAPPREQPLVKPASDAEVAAVALQG